MTHSVTDRKPFGLEQPSSSSDDEQKPQINGTTKSEGRVPGFIAKAYEIFGNTSYAAYCGWSQHGDTIMIHNIAEFASRVLPKYFKHSNYASFVRQLNMYDFHKTCSNPQIAEFQHPSFIHSRPELLRMIKRKSRRDAAVAQQEKLALAASMSASMNLGGHGHGHGHNMRPPTMERRSTPDGRVSPLTGTTGYHQHQHQLQQQHQYQQQHQAATRGPHCDVTSHSVDDVAPVLAEVIPAAANLKVEPGTEPARYGHMPHGAKRKATNFDADVERPTKHHTMTHSNSHCAASTSSHHPAAPEANGPQRTSSAGASDHNHNGSLSMDQDWKIAIERHLLGFQAEIQSLRQENLNLRRCLNETDRRMETMLSCSNNSARGSRSTKAPTRYRAHVRDRDRDRDRDRERAPSFELSPDTVEEYKYELSPDTSPEWTGLLNDVDYDVDSEGIIGSLLNL